MKQYKQILKTVKSLHNSIEYLNAEQIESTLLNLSFDLDLIELSSAYNLIDSYLIDAINSANKKSLLDIDFYLTELTSAIDFTIAMLEDC